MEILHLLRLPGVPHVEEEEEEEEQGLDTKEEELVEHGKYDGEGEKGRRRKKSGVRQRKWGE